MNRLGWQSGFNKRVGGISGHAFADSIIFTGTHFDKLSLNDLSSSLKIRHNVVITKQGVDDRFSDASIQFMKTLLKELLRKILSNSPYVEEFSDFEAIRIKDSTSFQIPAYLAKYFPGSGGAASKAMLRIQFEFDYKSGLVHDLSIHPFNVQDQTDSLKTIHTIKKNELIIRDLGYVNRNFLESIVLKEAYYLNRSGANTGIFLKENGELNKINFVKLKNKMKKQGIHSIDTTGHFYEGENKFESRMIIELLPDEVISERNRKIEKEAKKKGRKPSKEHKARAHFNIFITNVSEDILPKEKVQKLYCLRWQIELVFKTWKSFGGIHKTKKMKYERFVTCLYARLTLLILNWKIFWELAWRKWSADKIIISIHKFHKLMRVNITDVRNAILKTASYFQEQMNNILNCTNNLVLEKKKKKHSLHDIIMLLVE